MQYKTIILELLRQHPKIHNRFRKSRTLLSTMELYARQLETSHATWMYHLFQASPGSSQGQIASEALEIALKELADSLHSASSPESSEELSLEGAMAFIRRRTPPA